MKKIIFGALFVIIGLPFFVIGLLSKELSLFLIAGCVMLVGILICGYEAYRRK